MEAMGGTAPDLMTAAFLSMQPPSTVVAFAREVGGGLVTALSQQFFLEKCFNNEPLAERCYTTLTFIIPESARPNLAETLGEERASDLIGIKLLTVRVSLNMLDGDTGYILWPAGLYLAEVLLCHPQLVHGKSCLELGSGTGICGIWLSMLAPSKAVLTDGALSTLVNLRHNLETNGIPISGNTTTPDNGTHYPETLVDSRQLLWETTSEEELLSLRAQVILGSDLIYDPTIVPHLVRALAIMLQRRPLPRQGLSDRDSDEGMALITEDDEVLAPVAYIASALRTLTTLHLFFKLADAAGLEVTDVTKAFMPLRILPDIYDFDRSQIRLYKVVSRHEAG